MESEIVKKGLEGVKFCHIPMTAIEQKRLITKYTKQIINDPNKKWIISNPSIQTLAFRRYQNQKWEQIFRFMVESDAFSLWLSQNEYPNILRDICQILQIWGNNISNFEAIQGLHAPNLKILNIEKNCLSSLKSLRKFLCSGLEEVEYGKNFIIETSPLQETCLKQNRTKAVFNQRFAFIYCSKQDQVYEESIGWLFKIQSKTLCELCMVSRNRIREEKVMLMLKKRFCGIKAKARQLGKNYYDDHEIKRLIQTPRLQYSPIDVNEQYSRMI